MKNDIEYNNIVKKILENNEFNKLKNIEHHGISRYNHSLRVSYYSYKISKKMGLDYVGVARGGLLHDFFLSNEDRKMKERFLSTFTHPKKALKKSLENFDLSDKEQDMIKTHMFPINYRLPKYSESWIVSLVDKYVAFIELGKKVGYKFIYVSNLLLIVIMNSFK